MTKQIVANLLIFEKEWKKGTKQSQLIREASQLGFRKVEIRREYFFNVQEEIDDVIMAAKETGVELFYSVPDVIFKNGSINENLQLYLSEASKMGVKKIKWNIGDYKNFKGDLYETLTPIVSQGIEVNVENDQSEENGTIKPISRFLNDIKSQNIDLGYVFDIGNWLFVGEDPIVAAESLSVYTRYIHLKDILLTNGNPFVKSIDRGNLAWRRILNLLPNDIPIAIEYPTENHEEIEENLSELYSFNEVKTWQK